MLSTTDSTFMAGIRLRRVRAASSIGCLAAGLVLASLSAPAWAGSALESLVPITGWAAVLEQPLPRFLFQLIVVLSVAKLAGAILRRAGQPAVIGEMAAGIVLGPLLLGQFWPEFHLWLFAADALQPLYLVGQIGILMFLFVAGAELDPGSIKGGRRAALVVSHVGIALPFLLGVALAVVLYEEHAPTGAGLAQFAVFFGLAISVTAFPVLLRILRDRAMADTPLGRLAMASAAIADMLAWALLALVAASVEQQGWAGALPRIAGLGLFAAVIIFLIRPRVATLKVCEEHLERWLGLLVLLAMVFSLMAEALGVHALFGAFLAGVMVSGNAPFRHMLAARVEPFATAMLLPLFFAMAGFKLNPDALVLSDVALCLLVIVVAVAGKFGGTLLAAYWCGLERADALRLSALMNTRGLMELVVVTLGFELGLIGERLFVVMVFMALATTAMTGPLLALIDRWHGQPARLVTRAP